MHGSYLNITGIRSVFQLLKSLKILPTVSNVDERLVRYKVDTISSVFTVARCMRGKLISHHSQVDPGITVQIKTRFPGIIIKNASYMGNVACIYFSKKGKCVMCGMKTFDDVKIYSDYMRTFFDNLSEY